MSTGTTPPKATRRDWIGLAVIALPCLLYSMDLTVLNLALPALSAHLAPTSSQLLWIVDIYGFLLAGSLITMGTLGDRIGRRRLLMIGAAAFGVASVCAAFSTSAEMLIVTRALHGIAGATLAPSTLSLIRNMFLDERERTVAIGVWISSFSVGAAIGPLIGGMLLEHFWWGSVFLINVPVMLLLLAVGPLLLPEFRDPNAGRIDLPSAALSLGAVLPVIYGLKRLAEGGPLVLSVLTVLLGMAFGTLFVRRQQRLPEPMLDLKLFRIPTFRASLAVYLTTCFAAFGVFVFISQYLQLVLGMSPLEAGLWLLPWSGGFVVGSIASPWIVHRIRPAVVMSSGLVVAAIGVALLTLMTGTYPLVMLVAGCVLFSLGLSPAITLATDMIVGSAPPERAGAASAISETSAEFGGALGIAVLGSIGTAIYRGAMPGNVPETARATIGGAVAEAERLPAELRESLVTLARDAFAQAFEVAATINAVLVFATAILAALLLNRTAARAAA